MFAVYPSGPPVGATTEVGCPFGYFVNEETETQTGNIYLITCNLLGEKLKVETRS